MRIRWPLTPTGCEAVGLVMQCRRAGSPPLRRRLMALGFEIGERMLQAFQFLSILAISHVQVAQLDLDQINQRFDGLR